ncbi:hypothetical protein RFM41_32675 [Mesorhizobium sp. VK25A]|uniref:Antitoxin Xre/MbcA/ParS-like toxin-binding domain-containing protein n=3 Tax=Mesorhizobium TaxID=68287 RepID=A0ABU5AEQ0_9HYPH|nr:MULTISPECIES: hypothetical protein [unclassified Mesorhizobium]MDX8449225.1 hypothetical protein [Mesorhizobium sp. VK3C]MDX8463219.1 hypothetical protein [Mesorhizobium sp. VK2D]MDX8480063.1 hypothetical protein [Mesorhizobium sp. VK24D]MDX8488437.1 hypothetical protein [Mesorhizobium sp. VK2B]MDX8522434.1 hypothetical protein [Mesorhizobium sp. VK23D]
MSDALFSSFLMVDRPHAPIGGRRTSGGARAQERPSRTVSDDRELLVGAIRRALQETAPALAAPATATSTGFVDLAAAAADIALGHSVVLQLKPDLDQGRRSAVRSFLEIVVRVSATLDETRLESAISKLAEVLLPDELADARGALASDNLELRDRFVSEVPQLTSAEIGAQAGLKTKNPYATAARWKKAGNIFSVQHRGKEYFPAFQFREGRPHPTIKKALGALPPRLSAWQRAFWFMSTNGWLADKAPADMLDSPQSIIAAAEREGQEVVG